MAIQVKNINKSFDSKKTEKLSVLENINLNIEDGEFVCLLGPSGCGKTTLLRSILGEIKPIDGKVELGDYLQIGYFEQEIKE